MEREKLEVVAGSAAHPPGTHHVEVLLIGYPHLAGERKWAWEFELGPVAAKTLAVLLATAAQECEALESEHE